MSWDRRWVAFWNRRREKPADSAAINMYNAASQGYLICLFAKWASRGTARGVWEEAQFAFLTGALLILAVVAVSWVIEKGIDAIHGR